MSAGRGRQSRHPRFSEPVTEMLESQKRRRVETELLLLPAISQIAAAAGLWRRLGTDRGPRELTAVLGADNVQLEDIGQPRLEAQAQMQDLAASVNTKERLRKLSDPGWTPGGALAKITELVTARLFCCPFSMVCKAQLPSLP